MAEKKASSAKKSTAPAKPEPAAVKKAAVSAPAPVKKAAASAAVAAQPAKAAVSPAQRWKLVAEAAYYFAEKRGFAAGHSVADWLAAERQVDAKLRS